MTNKKKKKRDPMPNTDEKTQPTAADLRARASGNETTTAQPTHPTQPAPRVNVTAPVNEPTAAQLRQGAEPKPPSTPSTPNAKAAIAGTASPALSSFRARANQALDLSHSLLQEATALAQHTGPAPAGFGVELRELSDTLHRVEKQAESAKKFLRLASDLSKTRPKA
jgi:hypothetical protein